METNFSSERSEARQASSNIVDSLLFQAIDQVDMEADYRTNFLDFFERVVESEPAFSPGMSSEAEFDWDLNPPFRPKPPTHISPTSNTKPPASPDSSSGSFAFSISPSLPKAGCERTESPSDHLALYLSSAESKSPALPSNLAQLMSGDFTSPRACPVSPGLDLQPTQGPLQPPKKKLKLSLSVRDQDVNANIAEDAAEIMEDLEDGEVERYNLIRKLAEKFLLAVPSVHPRVSLKPAGDCSPVTEDAPGGDPVPSSFSTGPPGLDCPNLRRKS